MSRYPARASVLHVVLPSALSIEALAFLFAALLHTGISISFLPAFFHDPRIIGATVVEGACGLFLYLAVFRATVGHRAAWGTAIGAQVFSIAADIAGMVFIAAGFGPDSPFNFWFHRAGIAILIIVLAILLMPGTRAAFGRGPADVPDGSRIRRNRRTQDDTRGHMGAGS